MRTVTRNGWGGEECVEEEGKETESCILDGCGDTQCTQPYTVLRDQWRRIQYGNIFPTVHCDKQALGWTRFSFPESPYAQIPTSPPPQEYLGHDSSMRTCGTAAVSWMEGDLPKFGDTPKTMEMNFAWTNGRTKHGSYSTEVVSCKEQPHTQEFILYNLKPTPGGWLGAHCAI